MLYNSSIFADMSIKTQVTLEGKALELVLIEQAKAAKKGVVGKDRVINMLLTELHERRLLDTIIEPHLISNAEWKKFLKSK